MSAKSEIEILLFDDHAPLVKSTVRDLEEHGYRVVGVTDPKGALELIKEDRKRFGVALLDILYQKDSTAAGPRDPPVGLEMLRELTQEGGAAKVIMWSQTTDLNHAIEAINAGALAFRPKTAEPEDVFLYVENAVQAAYAELVRRRDFERLADLQAGLMSRQQSATKVFKMTADCRPSPGMEVSGDFYRYLDFGPERRGVFLGDVMGHGLASAFVTGMVFTMFAGTPVEDLSAAGFLRLLHKKLWSLFGERGEIQYIAAAFCLFDDSDSTFRYAILGQTPPLFLWRTSEGRCEVLNERSRLLGAIKEFDLESFPTVKMEQGDRLVLCTDGVANFDSDRRGSTEKIQSIIEENAASTDDEVSSMILAAEDSGEDDKTVIVVSLIG